MCISAACEAKIKRVANEQDFVRVFGANCGNMKSPSSKTDALGFDLSRKSYSCVTGFNLPSSKSTFSQPFKEKCISDGVRVSSVVILSVSHEKPSLHTV